MDVSESSLSPYQTKMIRQPAIYQLYLMPLAGGTFSQTVAGNVGIAGWAGVAAEPSVDGIAGTAGVPMAA
jgi:hypothetical protein